MDMEPTNNPSVFSDLILSSSTPTSHPSFRSEAPSYSPSISPTSVSPTFLPSLRSSISPSMAPTVSVSEYLDEFYNFISERDNYNVLLVVFIDIVLLMYCAQRQSNSNSVLKPSNQGYQSLSTDDDDHNNNNNNNNGYTNKNKSSQNMTDDAKHELLIKAHAEIVKLRNQVELLTSSKIEVLESVLTVNKQNELLKEKVKALTLELNQYRSDVNQINES